MKALLDNQIVYCIALKNLGILIRSRKTSKFINNIPFIKQIVSKAFVSLKQKSPDFNNRGFLLKSICTIQIKIIYFDIQFQNNHQLK